MPNGDIVSGCSDGIIRVFSEKEEHWAPAEVLKEYEEKVASQALPSQQVGDLNKEQLEGPESLNIPGRPIIKIHIVQYLFSCFQGGKKAKSRWLEMALLLKLIR
jgi:phospholipase A-2-activating protein